VEQVDDRVLNGRSVGGQVDVTGPVRAHNEFGILTRQTVPPSGPVATRADPAGSSLRQPVQDERLRPGPPDSPSARATAAISHHIARELIFVFCVLAFRIRYILLDKLFDGSFVIVHQFFNIVLVSPDECQDGTPELFEIVLFVPRDIRRCGCRHESRKDVTLWFDQHREKTGTFS